MNIKQSFSMRRIKGLIQKEFILIMRDKGTIAMLVFMPIIMLILFGFAITMDPKNLPTAIISYDSSPLTRNFISNLETSGYFNLVDPVSDPEDAKQKLSIGQLSFSIMIPANFTRKYIRGENPQLMVAIDGSDPGSSASALSHIKPIIDLSINQFTRTGLRDNFTSAVNRPINLTIHRMYNETNNSAFNIVPGLIGVLLTMTMAMLTSTAITSEFETGTMEMLLSTPLHPTEIILGKVTPYIDFSWV